MLTNFKSHFNKRFTRFKYFPAQFGWYVLLPWLKLYEHKKLLVRVYRTNESQYRYRLDHKLPGSEIIITSEAVRYK